MIAQYIYLNHSNGIHYDVVLDVNADDLTESISQTSCQMTYTILKQKKKQSQNNNLKTLATLNKNKLKAYLQRKMLNHTLQKDNINYNII